MFKFFQIFIHLELSKIFAARIYKLLLERDDRCPEDQRLWLQHEALRQGHLQETGTFRKALWQKLSSIVSPMLSEVIAFCDQNHNLDLLREGKEWKTRLWLTIISDEVITPLAYDSFISPVSGRLRQRARVLSTGTGPRFNGKFPFSWIIKDLVNVLLRKVGGECFHNEDFGLRNFRVFLCTVTKRIAWIASSKYIFILIDCIIHRDSKLVFCVRALRKLNDLNTRSV